MTREERFNTLTHAVPLLLLLSVSWWLIWRAYEHGWQLTFGVSVFTVGMLFMYTSSCLYHLWRPGIRKARLRMMDHIGIYVMIACSYTPIYMVMVAGGNAAIGWTFFGIIWAIAALGILYKVFLWRRYPKWSLTVYLLMGWSVLPVIYEVWKEIPLAPMLFILGEGICYTSGCYFYARDERYPFYHGIWHLFVFAGTLCHFIAVALLTL
ncbi:MAG: hemolysin III family protein [Bacteroidaceae bacterium]|nr:hemolysin III family protein [Bacteroidaceae bacterium]